MAQATAMKAELKHFATPDETRTFENGKIESLTMSTGTISRYLIQPGWRWSEHVKPIAGTPLCEVPHCQYIVSGKLAVRMADGTTMEAGPGDVAFLPPGHDAWVVGNEPVVSIDWQGATNYAKPK